jgi:serine/threonine protein kinase
MEIVTLLLENGGDEPGEQLVARNSLGQRPSEVSLDIQTAELFRELEDRLSNGSDVSDSESRMDRYAGRTPFHQGAVLLPNSRADVVSRLLRSTQGSPQPDMSGEGDNSESPGRRKSGPLASPARRGAPFLRLRPFRPAIESVGPDSFTYVKRLGKGSFGEVFQVRHRDSGQVYAMKVLRKNRIIPENLLRYAMTERNVLSYMHHPYIVSLYFAFQTSQNLVMVLQFCPGGNLQQLIERVRRVPEPVARLYTAEILLALCHIHERSIVFRDLKPDNIVIDEGGHAVLTDFGLSKEGVSHLHRTRSFCGSVAFLAPEILRRQGHNHTVDIYGLGVVLFDMLTGLPPFYHPDRETLFTNIRHSRLQIPRYVSEPATSLIESLMVREPSGRLGANSTEDIKEHRFFSTIDFEAVMNREVPVPRMGGVGHPSASLELKSGHREAPLRGVPIDNRQRGNPSEAVPFWTFISSEDP